MGLPVCAEESSLILFLEKNPPPNFFARGCLRRSSLHRHPRVSKLPKSRHVQVCVDQPLTCWERKKRKKSNGTELRWTNLRNSWAEPQRIVAHRPLYRLQYPVPPSSRLHVIPPALMIISIGGQPGSAFRVSGLWSTLTLVHEEINSSIRTLGSRRGQQTSSCLRHGFWLRGVQP